MLPIWNGKESDEEMSYDTTSYLLVSLSVKCIELDYP